MSSLFSHIVQKRLSQESENVATSALEFILDKSDAARGGFHAFLKGVLPHLPELYFHTQEMDGSSRPDMWGCDDQRLPHVFVENKFWAGFTNKQPVEYLKSLAKQPHPTMLLMVVPEARLTTVWDELCMRVTNAGGTIEKSKAPAGIVNQAITSFGPITGSCPIMALTSWKRLLSHLEHTLANAFEDNDRSALSDLSQLQALCDAEDSSAVGPFNAEELTNQQQPGLMLRLASIVLSASEKAASDKVLAGAGRWAGTPAMGMGRVARFHGYSRGVGLWFGVHWDLWKTQGGSPLWATFESSGWVREAEMIVRLKPWAKEQKLISVNHSKDGFAIALEVKAGVEKEEVVRSLVSQLKDIYEVLKVLPPSTAGGKDPLDTDVEVSDQ